MCITIRLVLLSGLLYTSSSESDTSDDSSSYDVETSEDEEYKGVEGLDIGLTTTTSKSKRRSTTEEDYAGVPLYKPNATEQERINKQYEAWLFATNPPPTVKKPEPNGPFYGFIKNLCNVTISRLSIRKIRTYLTVLAKSLKGIGCGFIMKRWVRKFRKRIRSMSDYKKKFIDAIVQTFCNYITEWRHFKNMFFDTINPIFSMIDDNRFDDYIYDLKRFGARRLRNIEKKTSYVFKRIIQRRLNRQKKSVLDNIMLKFDLLLIEHHGLKKKDVIKL